MSAPQDDAALAAALFAIDPPRAGGLALRSRAGPARERWLANFFSLLPPRMPVVRLPLHAAEDRVFGGLDLAATLRTGRAVLQKTLLAQAEGGVLVVAMAERLERATATRLAMALDRSSFALLLLDEGIDDERPDAALLDRVAFQIELDPRGGGSSPFRSENIAAAHTRLLGVRSGEGLLRAFSAAALRLGIASMRAELLALHAARASAALAGRDEMTDEDAAVAARLVLAPRATRLPPDAPAPEEKSEKKEEAKSDSQAAEDIVLEAAAAAIPAGLLDPLRRRSAKRARAGASGRGGEPVRFARRGRPAGVRRESIRRGARLNLVETLRAAAPWQRLRRGAREMRVRVLPEDFRVQRFRSRAPCTTIFSVDASGSAALHRLAEAKGAVELLLAECYLRRDRVALVAFRGRDAQVLLPPTRSLVRAKRSLAALPGGGGTPLAAGIDGALSLALAVERMGERPNVVLLTDGRANVARDGAGSRATAAQEALAAARRVGAAGIDAVLVDTSPRPEPLARELAAAMQARYVPLPHANAQALARAASPLPQRSQ